MFSATRPMYSSFQDILTTLLVSKMQSALPTMYFQNQLICGLTTTNTRQPTTLTIYAFHMHTHKRQGTHMHENKMHMNFLCILGRVHVRHANKRGKKESGCRRWKSRQGASPPVICTDSNGQGYFTGWVFFFQKQLIADKIVHPAIGVCAGSHYYMCNAKRSAQSTSLL